MTTPLGMMMKMTNTATKIKALNEAYALGAEFKVWEDDVWSWCWGQRSSVDQYCKSFKTILDAAEDFVQSREATQARKMR